ncbi:MAG TPA: zinc-binding dehydrogenase [Verrucomicrobiae bacterium]|nr:zinc-binding dehydrogenase [Verrucomicrobiae bacterium]
MQAAVFAAPTRARVEKVKVPPPGERQVRVRLEGCGVCGSNLAPWEGRPWFKYPFDPGAPGHEGWGYVEAVGPNTTRASVGDRVALLSYNAFAECDVASEDALVPLPLELKGKPFPGEALGCALNVFKRCDIRPGQFVAIVGIGFLGALLTSLAARACAQVMAISRRPFALEIARTFGAIETLPFDGALDTVMKLTDGLGCERVIEAVGNQSSLELATNLTRERGRLTIAGYHQDGLRQVNMQLWNWRGIDVINAHERDARVYVEGMRAAADAVARGDLDPSPLYTHKFALDEISDAFTALRERPGRFMKALITYD